ncbi:MAG TPA: TMEM165/GDT1 family protein [Verrucomicrobiae bacterium]|jgi:putative Ca2+/H+ antiporter (TMEM165/GDT1 family)|nr:TMEM165/GDT1 family protein [Verrucomicrobiae bacterium]
MLVHFIIPFISIFLAELGDKTQLALFVLGSKTQKRLVLFFGAMLGFMLADGFGIFAGAWISRFVPVWIMKLLAAVIFFVFGFLMLRSVGESEPQQEFLFQHPFLMGFGFTFLAEWADKTQIAAALFATRYNLALVVLATLSALALSSGIALFLGHAMASRVRPAILRKAAGWIFIFMGVTFIFF